MALTRQSIVRGPGCVYYNAGVSQVAIPADGGIDADAAIAEAAINEDVNGQIDARYADCVGKITWKPVGITTQAIIDILFPTILRTPVRGTDLLGSADVPWLVHSKAGETVEYAAGAVTKSPQLVLSAVAPIFGGTAEVTCCRGNGLEWSNAAAFYTIATAAFSAPAIPSANIVTQKYTGVWGSTLASIVSESGWTIDQTVTVQPDTIDGYGTNGMILDSVGYVAKCRPKNLDEDILDALDIQAGSVVIGATRRTGDNLVITGTSGFAVTLYDARILRGPLVWRGIEVRVGEIAFAATRLEDTGTYGALIGFTFPA